MFDEENFEERWNDFTVEVFGVESSGSPMLPRNSAGVLVSPPGPFFFLASFFPKGSQTAHYYQFFVCRVKHKTSDLCLVSHWWQSHGRLINLQGSLSPFPLNWELDIIKDALDFFLKETRGGQEKFTEEMMSDVLRMLGPHATIRAAANSLQVTETTLNRWRRRHGMRAWRDVINRYSGTNSENA
ncbi:MAG: RWP-RK domain-containing protein [Acidobacteriota bacterium]|nr:RWP-RK domain-containing protein [Acidobacteriota bacterium]